MFSSGPRRFFSSIADSFRNMSKRRRHTGDSETREFPNPYSDYQGEQLLSKNGLLPEEFRKKVKEEIEKHMKKLDEGIATEVDETDSSVYTGVTGIALLHFHMYEVMDKGENDRYLKQALSLIERPMRHLRRRRLTFLCGDAGPLALGAVIYDKLGKFDHKKTCIERLVSRQKDVIEDTSLPDEFLFGRVGYLFSLLFVQHHLGQDIIDDAILEKVYETIINSGKELSKKEGSKSPLMYEWHDKKYLGAAHGLVGIFYTLMQVKDTKYKHYLEELVKPSIEYLMTLQFPSGNYPSSIGSSTGDKLVHWCHGAPGWIHMFIMAHKVFGDDKYLEAAKSCADVLWSRGLLRKGYGICHGVAGNAYGFLALYRLTNDEKYLYRAMKFAEWCFDYGSHGCNTPDRPYSLFEGLAGTMYFLVDMLDPKNAKFPAFEL